MACILCSCTVQIKDSSEIYRFCKYWHLWETRSADYLVGFVWTFEWFHSFRATWIDCHWRVGYRWLLLRSVGSFLGTGQEVIADMFCLQPISLLPAAWWPCTLDWSSSEGIRQLQVFKKRRKGMLKRRVY